MCEAMSHEKRTKTAALGYPVLAGLFLLLGLTVAISRVDALEGWSEVFTLTPGARDIEDAVIAAQDQTIFVVYRKQGLFCICSEDNGKHWSEPVLASGDAKGSRFPSILFKDSVLHLAWSAPMTVATEVVNQIFYTQSSDQGRTWRAPIHLAETTTHGMRPQILPIRGGIVIIWYELDQRQVLSKSPLDFKLIERYLENPALNVIPIEKRDVVRSSIQAIRSLNEGKSFLGARKTVHETLGALTVFSAYETADHRIGVCWDDKQSVLFMESNDDGATWDYNWKLRDSIPTRTMLDQVLSTEGEIVQVLTPIEPFQNVSISVKVGERKPIEVVSMVKLQSFPRIAQAGQDIHLAWVQQRDDEMVAKYMRTDKHRPTSRILSPTDPKITTPRFNIEWEGQDDISSKMFFTHSLDKLNWANWESELYGITITTPEDGEYDFYLKAKDMAGNIQAEPAHFHFNTFSVAPDTFLVGTPPKVVNSRSLSLEWDGFDNNPSVGSLQFQYRLDFGEWSTFSQQQQVTFRDLSEGSHTVEVRAKDKSDNVDATPASHSFVVKLNIRPKFITVPEGLLSSNTVSFHWEAQDDTTDKAQFFFSYQLDGGLWSAYSPASNLDLADLSEGRHRLLVRARDEQGNVSQETLEHEFVVDMTPPKVTIALSKLDSSTEHKPMIELQAEDNFSTGDDIQFQVRIEEGTWTEWDPVRVVTLGTPIKPWSKGYRIEAKAMDEAGNITSEPEVYSLLLRDRYPLWLLIVPIAVPAVIGLLVLIGFIKSSLASRRRRKSPKSTTPDDMSNFGQPPSASASTSEDDLF